MSFDAAYTNFLVVQHVTHDLRPHIFYVGITTDYAHYLLTYPFSCITDLAEPPPSSGGEESDSDDPIVRRQRKRRDLRAAQEARGDDGDEGGDGHGGR